METINLQKSFNDKYVNLASGLGFTNAKSEQRATWNEYFVFGYLIAKTFSDDYAEKGYVEHDSCSWLWEGSGLKREEVNEAIYWLIINDYVDQLWFEGPRLAYKVANWVVEKVRARMVDDDLTWAIDE